MIIEKYNDTTLHVESNIYFDDSEYFCGRPYITLFAHKEQTNWWKGCTIAIGIRDNDDFDVGLVYETDKEHFEDVLHELINWMRDHEQGMSFYEDIWDGVYYGMNFFPDCGCNRHRW